MRKRKRLEASGEERSEKGEVGGKGSDMVMRRAKMLELGPMRADHTCVQCQQSIGNLGVAARRMYCRAGYILERVRRGSCNNEKQQRDGSRPGRGKSPPKIGRLSRWAKTRDAGAGAGCRSGSCKQMARTNSARALDEVGRQDEGETRWISCCSSKDGPSIRTKLSPTRRWRPRLTRKGSGSPLALRVCYKRISVTNMSESPGS